MSLAENASQAVESQIDVHVPNKPDHGPKFRLDIEGVIYDWADETITTEQIAQLGGWDVSAGVIQIDADQNERQLQPGEVVELKPGMGFSKKVRWKRGLAHG